MDAATTLQQRQRVRFDVLRRQIFEEMSQTAARWRLAWIVPFNVFTLAVLIARGEPTGRALIQSAALLVSVGLFVHRVRQPAACSDPFGMFAGAGTYLVSVANTGGLGSPLLISGFPLIVAAALNPLTVRARTAFFTFFVGAFALMALLSRTAVGELASPLAPVGGSSAPEYVLLAMGSVVFAGFAVYAMGQRISKVYERVAFELAARREEICTDTEDRTKALEGIAARLAHEVKNPLAAIKGLSTHMARNAADPKVAERLSIVAAEADRLEAIVDGFLSFSRGLEELSLAPSRPHEIARELTVLLETRAADSGVNLEVKGNADLVLNADSRKLRQALLNLVLNAMQASAEGSTVTIDVGRSNICGGFGALIRVVDRGPGMTPDVLERIKKPYFTTREGGSGLGIAVARGLIEQHGGQLKYESSPGKGTTVTIDLPMCSLAAKKAHELPNPVRDAVQHARTQDQTSEA